ncbi:MAG: hypothetical protein K0V04_24465 [Deltaproteobacteria bacterium]|nr:hypothetical protein [Deltaproteobacteria bacterium]
MRFDDPFTLPYEPPAVPWRLEQKIADSVEGAFRINLQVEQGGGWLKINALQLDEPLGGGDAPLLAALVVACAEKHAGWRMEGRYRAIVWRKVGAERERRVTTFRVPESQPRTRRDRRGRSVPGVGPDFQRVWAQVRETMLAYEVILLAAAAETRRQRMAVQAETIRERLPLLVGSYLHGLIAPDTPTRAAAKEVVHRVFGEIEQDCDPDVFREFCGIVPGLLRGVRTQVVTRLDELDPSPE